ncbi:hypothetical protein D3C86_2014590 [compost metagenome]
MGNWPKDNAIHFRDALHDGVRKSRSLLFQGFQADICLFNLKIKLEVLIGLAKDAKGCLSDFETDTITGKHKKAHDNFLTLQ